MASARITATAIFNRLATAYNVARTAFNSKQRADMAEVQEKISALDKRMRPALALHIRNNLECKVVEHYDVNNLLNFMKHGQSMSHSPTVYVSYDEEHGPANMSAELKTMLDELTALHKELEVIGQRQAPKPPNSDEIYGIVVEQTVFHDKEGVELANALFEAARTHYDLPKLAEPQSVLPAPAKN